MRDDLFAYLENVTGGSYPALTHELCAGFNSAAVNLLPGYLPTSDGSAIDAMGGWMSGNENIVLGVIAIMDSVHDFVYGDGTNDGIVTLWEAA